MEIRCSEKCRYMQDGLCFKGDCKTENGYIFGADTCPLNPTVSPAVLTDRRRSEPGKELSASVYF